MEQNKQTKSKQVIEVNNMLVDCIIKTANLNKGISMLIDLYNNNDQDINRLDILNNGEILISMKEFEDYQTKLVETANLFFKKIDTILRALYQDQIKEKEQNGKEEQE